VKEKPTVEGFEVKTILKDFFFATSCQVVKLQTIMFFYVYVLESSRNSNLYVGSTNNLVRRIKEHNRGLNRSTKPYKPWRLIYYEACLCEEDAKRREYYLKTNQGGRLLKRRIKEYLYTRRFA